MKQERTREVTHAIRDLTRKVRRVTVIFRVVTIGESRIVKSRKTGKRLLVADAVVADETAKIRLTLWNDDIDEIEEGLCYRLNNGRLEIYDESLVLSKSFSGEIIPLDYEIAPVMTDVDMSKPFMGTTPKRRKARSKEGRTFQGIPGIDQRGYCSDKEF
ncbi:MAG: hypothetical protein P1Q69_05270 [Candidatus Thorarchaeota archaeon]|nr:hypothetical protein [Candidatus Thorarchaeota archaeon]